jgi:hypothetical protein
VSGLDYPAIRSRISIRCVLELLRYQAVTQFGPQWRGPCPLCSNGVGTAHERCFSVHISRNLFHCFRCRRSGNQLDLWVHISGLALRPATLDLCQRLRVEPITLENPQPRNHH